MKGQHRPNRLSPFKDRARFQKKGHKAPAAGIDLSEFQELGPKTLAPGTDKTQKRHHKTPPKEQPGDNHRNGETSYLRMGHLHRAAPSHRMVNRS